MAFSHALTRPCLSQENHYKQLPSDAAYCSHDILDTIITQENQGLSGPPAAGKEAAPKGPTLHRRSHAAIGTLLCGVPCDKAALRAVG